MGQGLAPCDAILEQHPDVPSDIRAHAWEVGRLVLVPEYRAGPELLRRCLALTLSHVVEHTDTQHFFASCKPVLARLYRRFGMSALLKVAGNSAGEEPYSLIHGSVQSVMDAVSDEAPLSAKPAMLQ